MAARMPAATNKKRKAKADDISEKDEFHLPQIVSQLFAFTQRVPVAHNTNTANTVERLLLIFGAAGGRNIKVHNRGRFE